MRKILLFGNSGSGKSTLALELCSARQLAYLDLDTLAWQPSDPPARAALETSSAEIRQFTRKNDAWAIEGCYTDLLEIAAPQATEIIFLNLPVAACVNNARSRPWEPHKYESKKAQDKNLDMLIDWIRQYEDRNDVCSRTAHRDFYAKFPGAKLMHTSNERSSAQQEKP